MIRRNSGYIDYSMSVRAMEARESGKYPKSDFCRNYKVNAASLKLLVVCDIISDAEWHHTSKYYNATTFYSWKSESFFEAYKANKKQIDALAKEYNAFVEPVRPPYYDFADDNILPMLSNEENKEFWAAVRANDMEKRESIIAPYRELDEYKRIKEIVEKYNNELKAFTAGRVAIMEQIDKYFK